MVPNLKSKFLNLNMKTDVYTFISETSLESLKVRVDKQINYGDHRLSNTVA
jgi:hypothetical protein